MVQNQLAVHNNNSIIIKAITLLSDGRGGMQITHCILTSNCCFIVKHCCAAAVCVVTTSSSSSSSAGLFLFFS